MYVVKANNEHVAVLTIMVLTSNCESYKATQEYFVHMHLFHVAHTQL